MMPKKTHRLWRSLPPAVALMATLMAPQAHALDLSWSGFATFGWARSDADFAWQRHITRQGSWDRDSVLGGQLDARFSPHWSATVQLRAAPAIDQDKAWRLDASWAFLSWRPNNDWQLRGGKLRAPLYLYSETQDVGASTEFARLPVEQYWIAPTSDFTGLYATRSWTLGDAELSLDAYSGYAETTQRQWSINGLPPAVAAGAQFIDVRVQSTGLVFTARQPDVLWRFGVHTTRTRRLGADTSITAHYPRVEIAPGLGYWQVDDALPGPGVETADAIRNRLISAGVDWQLGQGWRLAAEVTDVRQQDTEIGVSLRAGYGALFKTVDRLTGYVSLSRMLTGASERGWKNRLMTELLPAAMPGADQINAAQALAGEMVPSFDQHTVALGLSYALTPNSRLKAEWAHTRIGSGSSMADSAPGTVAPSQSGVNVLSVNYSIAF